MFIITQHLLVDLILAYAVYFRYNLDWLALPLLFEILLVITFVKLKLGQDGVINLLGFILKAEFCPKSPVFSTFDCVCSRRLNKADFLLHLGSVHCLNVLDGSLFQQGAIPNSLFFRLSKHFLH
jgi:hypothetical protein